MTDKEKRKLHRKTIKIHRRYVRQMCWKFGLFWQGLTHDLSKYSKTEFDIYKYYTDGTCSPHKNAREAIGYSPSWMHHKNKNKHHWEYWLDNQDGGDWVPVKIPYKYVIEMFCDMAGASKAYAKGGWKPEMLWNYWVNNCKGKRIMHKDSETLLETLLWNYKEYVHNGLEKEFIKKYKELKHSIKNKYENESEMLSWISM